MATKLTVEFVRDVLQFVDEISLAAEWPPASTYLGKQYKQMAEEHTAEMVSFLKDNDLLWVQDDIIEAFREYVRAEVMDMCGEQVAEQALAEV